MPDRAQTIYVLDGKKLAVVPLQVHHEAGQSVTLKEGTFTISVIHRQVKRIDNNYEDCMIVQDVVLRRRG